MLIDAACLPHSGHERRGPATVTLPRIPSSSAAVVVVKRRYFYEDLLVLVTT